MGITSLKYLGFFIAVLIVYYALPKKCRWQFLVVASLSYSCLAAEPLLLVYPVVSVFIAWMCTNRMSGSAKKRFLLIVAILANLGVLIALKYLNLGVYTFNAIAQRLDTETQLLKVFHFMAPVGVSFYTMSILGYIFDVYYEIEKPEKNYFKLLLFGLYFPLVISGPIVRYKDIKIELFGQNSFNYKRVCWGFQRIILGFFKVLVISERLAVITQTVFEDFDNYPGAYIVFATVCYSFRLYCNFSGSMDIVLGISETLGIHLPENFRQPFFSKTIQEFWQRWHITLGAWLKDYILYPLLRTEFFMNLPKKWKDKLGKKRAKQYTTFFAMAVLWFAVGLWHGGAWKYIWGTGLLQCVYIIISELCTPHWKKVKAKLKVDDKSWGFVQFQRIRTFLLISLGFMFFNANSLSDGFRMLKSIITTWNPEVLVDGGILLLGLDIKDWFIVGVSLLILFTISIIKEKTDIRELLTRQNIAIRWIILYAAIFYVIILGSYGPGYSAAEFIYQGF